VNAGGQPAKRLAWWIFPSLLCLLIHWLGFTAWFRADDFAWLDLSNHVHSFHDLMVALFEPRAQGTIRPWSERAFFMAGYTLFGLDALPFRIAIFATQFADLALVASIGTRLTGRRAAGFWAAILWVVNSSMAQPLGWVCVYNEVLCAFFLLLAFHFLLQWIETGRARYYVLQWIVFLLGFGVLELNVVYPVLAAGYTFLCARKYFGRTLPLFAASILFAVAHQLAAPPVKSGLYAMHWDGSMLLTFAKLWSWSVSATYLASPLHLKHWMMLAGVAILTAALVWFAWRQWREGRRQVLFCFLWYLATVGPLLPLRDHTTEYYVYLPVIGLCWLGGWALARYPGIPAYFLAALYAFLTVPQMWDASEWNYEQTQRARTILEGIAGAHERHPMQQIALYGVDNELYWSAIRDRPFHLLGIQHVYLTPGSGRQIQAPSGWDDNLDEFVLPGSVATWGLQRNQLVVYDVRSPRLRNITSVYAAMPRDNSLPHRVDVGDPLVANLLGPEWYPLDGDHRWMARRASLKIGGPPAGGGKLYLSGNCADEELRSGPLTVVVTVDGSTLPAVPIRNASFEMALPLPASFNGKNEVKVVVEVDRTFRPASDPRELGLAFGVFEIR
jgi:hypothetical protein